jgi:hypothetical protein
MAQNAERIEAPDDVFVDRVIIADGPVVSNQQLLVLRSPRIERMLSRLAGFQQHIEIAERPFHDGRADEEIATIVAKAKALKDAKDDLDKQVEIITVKRTFRLGQILYGICWISR